MALNKFISNYKLFIKAFRIHHWLKNILIFSPLFASRNLNIQYYDLYISVFLIFSFAASTVYLLNDFFDAHDDKKNPEKRSRAFASGIINKNQLWALFFIMNCIVLAGALSINYAFFATIIAYLVLNISYSLYFKEIKYMDLICLISFYYLRVLAGITLIENNKFPTFWFFLFIAFLVLALSVAKRIVGIIKNASYNISDKRPYLFTDMRFLKTLFIFSILASIFLLFVYFFESKYLFRYQYLVISIPFLFSYFCFNFVILTFEGKMNSDPIIQILKQKKLFLSMFAIILIYLISY